MSWNDERVELLKKLWSEGLSASQIASELGGITRNAVIGKVHRLGLSGRTKSVAAPARPRKATRPEAPTPQQRPAAAPQRPATHGNTALAQMPEEDFEPAPAPAPVVADNVVTMSQRCTIMNLTEATCRWPIGEPGTDGFYFCGGRSVTGLPYCATHARLAYQPVQDRRRDRRLAYL
ncbi:GcrA family cell cycle regulator [Aquabacter sp. P-9]|uniref:GcrA family cell cycle regulator n=1 Tax=Aquabacter sediminis TaxID=3029197 RepID=UPI00237EAE56|nr:GcrA family cell cycle regulator [Aquabacter sp. P-9]MDE1570911.1 GcrA family cell cycle regulator [Aquabacter sp. P-9]